MSASVVGGVERRVAARVGLVGNPSDGFGGAVLSTIVPGLCATVIANAAAGVEIAGPLVTERWASMSSWIDDMQNGTFDGPQRVVAASMWTLASHLRRNGADLSAARGISLSWHTDIPMSVGLAGSSALAVGTIDAVAGCWGVTLDRRVSAALALSAERDILGIAAGWQDRIVQAFDRTVLTDAAIMDEVDGISVPAVHVVGDRPPVHLVVGWHVASSASSDDYHAPLRRDPSSLVAPMAELAALARVATSSLERGDTDAFANAVDDGWRIRQSCGPLRADHAELVESVRVLGVTATTPGSGGSVVAVCADDDAVTRVRSALAATGCGSLELAI